MLGWTLGASHADVGRSGDGKRIPRTLATEKHSRLGTLSPRMAAVSHSKVELGSLAQSERSKYTSEPWRGSGVLHPSFICQMVVGMRIHLQHLLRIKEVA